MTRIHIAAALALAVCAAPAAAGVRFDTAEAGSPKAASLLEAVRRAAGDDVPAVGEGKIVPAFWGSDGRWCDDGQVYHGGPCDPSTWGGYHPQPGPGPYNPQPPHHGGGQGIDEAMAVCAAMWADFEKLSCMRVVRTARFFDVPAVRVCRGLWADREKTSCLQAIVNVYVGPEAARICGGMWSDADKIRCLREQSGGYYPDPHGPRPRDGWREPVDPRRDDGCDHDGRGRRGPERRGLGQGPSRKPWRDPPTR